LTIESSIRPLQLKFPRSKKFWAKGVAAPPARTQKRKAGASRFHAQVGAYQPSFSQVNVAETHLAGGQPVKKEEYES
jgi:hypothetical protein